MTADAIPPEVTEMIATGALFAVSHSGGKDSQAQMIRLRSIVPPDQLVVIHAPLGRVEWPGTLAHIRATIGDTPLILAHAATDLLTAVRKRGKWPSPGVRFCTSGSKRDPIARELRRYLKANPRFGGRIVSCMGLRAVEGRDRARRAPVMRNERNSKAGREWWDWLPIHGWSEARVFSEISDAGERPHWVYAKGMTRCSCSFCIMATRKDLRRAARLRPRLAAEYIALEEEIDHTLSPTRVPLRGIVA
ncbi:phosphoadenosine phosphosulfate reductase family protein [uncultured Jannaschia sp.]|uniref:phosphoadenosine phosphosulfate reductase domain-containing protein n=1 Tax=uncultured Jannaschia sp. TaxID=293347 RepID=UPI0026396839|nr:phosphoadenosine phosphosulfate reductase family protein [uncultured Jannaschia sp.]